MLNDEMNDFRGKTKDIILDCRNGATWSGRDILIAVQMYLQFGPRTCGISSVERFEEKVLPEIRAGELAMAWRLPC